MRSTGNMLRSYPRVTAWRAASSASASAASARAEPRKMWRGNWSSAMMRARQSARLSSHSRLAPATSSSWSGRKRLLTSASKGASFSNQRLCRPPYSSPAPNQKRSTPDARWSLMVPDVKLAFAFNHSRETTRMNKTRRFIASLLVVSMTGLGLPLPSRAAIVGTDAALVAAQRDRVATMLDRGDVRAQLEAHGVRQADVKARVAALTDAEVAQLAGQLDSLPAGGEGIIGAIVIVFLVLLITDLLGLTKVFSFTRPVR